MLQTAGRCGGTGGVYVCYPKTEKLCGIHLVATSEPNQIRGKVQICSAYEIQHYGIVVELEGLITFSDRFKEVIKVFQPGSDSSTVLRSSVYCQICGRKEGLLTGDPLPSYAKKLRSQIFEFCLVLPTTYPIPAAFTTEHVDVTYNIIVYKRSTNGYERMAQKPLKFYGYYGLPSTSQPRHDPSASGIRKDSSVSGITATIVTPKSNYLRSENIHFTVTVRNEKRLPISAISVVLTRTTAAFSDSSIQVVDTFMLKKPSDRKEFCVRGVFKEKREIPTYIGSVGLRVTYAIMCEIFTRESAVVGGELEILIGTTVISVPPTETGSSPPETTSPRRIRSRCMSLASSMLSLFPPSYSQLSSRSGSMVSLQTLPPHYDDLLPDNPEPNADL